MTLALLHRRLAVLMGLAGLLAFAAGAGFEPVSAALALIALVVALFWHPSQHTSVRMEPVWLPVAALLVARALWHIVVVGDDVVIPVVDLLLLLLCTESLRSLDAPNDARLYALSFALLLAATAYRPGIVFAVAFVAYVTLATVALTLGHLRRKANRYGIANPPVDRSMVVATAGMGTVVLLMSGLVFLGFPRVSRGWAGHGELPVVAVAGFSDVVTIGEFGSRIEANPQIVLRVEFTDGRPADAADLYWRGRSYDRFDGMRWSRSYPLPPASAPGSWYRERWRGPMVRQRIFAAPLDTKVLFALHPAVRIDADSRTQALFDNAGDFVYWGLAAPAYTAWSMTAPPTTDDLRGATGGFFPGRNHYLQLPRLPDRIRTLTDSITAGTDARYDKVKAVEGFLRGFTYTLELPGSARAATLDHFLFERRSGHCEYFSTAMVVMLRTQGIHAREVNGFRGGEWSEFGNYLAVTQNQAHSWVEVWFPSYGWVTFDPTPAGTAGAISSTAWFWPGRFLFDAVQHRWNKWVLDYSVEAQWGLLDRLRTWSEEGVSGATPQAGGSGWMAWFLAVLVLAALGALLGHGQFRTRHPHETRAYLRLVELCRGAGVVSPAAVGPLELVKELERRRHPAAGAARRLVDLYLRARFGAHPLDEREQRVLAEALGNARSHLRPA